MKQYLITIAIILLVMAVWTYKNSVTNSSKSTSFSDSEASATDETNENAFSLEVKNSFNLDYLKSFHLPIIIDFGADWCPPCREMKPHFEKLYQTYKKEAILKYVDVDKLPQIAAQYPTQYIPVQVLFNSDGTPFAPQDASQRGLSFHYEGEKHVLTTHVGAISYEKMEQMLKEMGLDG